MKDFLAITDYSPEELQEMLDLAIKLKAKFDAFLQQGVTEKIDFDSTVRSLIALFEESP